MIKAVWRAPCALEVRGHAGYAPKGEDIVCAGVSTLWGTLLAALDAEERSGNGSVSVRDCIVAFRPAEDRADKIEDIVGVRWRGFLLLAASYADYVSAERLW